MVSFFLFALQRANVLKNSVSKILMDKPNRRNDFYFFLLLLFLLLLK